MLYILLVIIAVGVLLISEEGKGILRLLMKLALIAGFLYLGFWILMAVIAFFESPTGKGVLSSIEGFLLLLVGLVLLGVIGAGLGLLKKKISSRFPRFIVYYEKNMTLVHASILGVIILICILIISLQVLRQN